MSIYIILFVIFTTGSDSRMKLGLSPDCQVVCLCALTKFKEVCGRLQTRDITVNELKMIEKLQKNMERLCDSVTRFEEDSLSSEDLRVTLQQRLSEFQTFEKRRKSYIMICDLIPDCVQGEMFHAYMHMLEDSRELSNVHCQMHTVNNINYYMYTQNCGQGNSIQLLHAACEFYVCKLILLFTTISLSKWSNIIISNRHRYRYSINLVCASCFTYPMIRISY